MGQVKALAVGSVNRWKKKRECYGCITEKKVLQKQPIAPILDYGRKAIALKTARRILVTLVMS